MTITNTQQQSEEKATEKRMQGLRARDGLSYDQVGRSKESVAKSGHGGEEELRKSPMTARMLDAMRATPPVDIGHYGRLIFTMVARHFLSDAEMIALVSKQPGEDELTASSRILQVRARNYNPPKRDRILQWQREQQAGGVPFEIISKEELTDPRAANPYRDLRFPPGRVQADRRLLPGSPPGRSSGGPDGGGRQLGLTYRRVLALGQRLKTWLVLNG